MSTTWKDERDRATIYAGSQDETDEGCLKLTEEIALAWEPGHALDFTPSALYDPEQIANALLLITNYFEGGEMFYGSLSVLEKALVNHLTALIIELEANSAANASHKNEADERLSDSE